MDSVKTADEKIMVTENDLPEHGGDLAWAVKTFCRPEKEWIDLSTAISPWVYPVPRVPDKVWQRLPYNDQGLLASAAKYYGCSEQALLPVSGTQTAIQWIPTLLAASSVAIPNVGYKEHEYAWRKAGHNIQYYRTLDQLVALVAQKKVTHVVIVNPNNPTGEQWTKAALLEVQQSLPSGGYLIVDEAFMDSNNQHSLAAEADDNLIVLRSIGKFFGLAGIRLGFVIAHHSFLDVLRRQSPLWGVNHVALWLGEKVLADTDWQIQQRQRIHQQCRKIRAMLSVLPFQLSSDQGLFITLFGKKRELFSLFLQAARSGVLLRYGHCAHENNTWLRFGLPTDEQYLRLTQFITHYGDVSDEQ